MPERSLSPMPPVNVNYWSHKRSAGAASEDAANAITRRQQVITETENDRFDRRKKMSDSFKHEAAEARYYKQYKRGKKSIAFDRDFSHIEFKYKRAKKRAKIFAAQYEKLKSDLGYKSPEESSGSLSSGSNESDSSEHEDAGGTSDSSSNS